MASYCGNLTLCFGTVCGCARATVVFGVFVWYVYSWATQFMGYQAHCRNRIAWCISLYIVIRAIITYNNRTDQDVEVGGGPMVEGNSGDSYPMPVATHSQVPQQQAQQQVLDSGYQGPDVNVVHAQPADDMAGVHYAHPSPPPPAAGGYTMPTADAYGGRRD